MGGGDILQLAYVTLMRGNESVVNQHN